MQSTNTYPIIEKLKRVLIVSCQAAEGEPLAAPEHIKALALSAIKGGAKGLRLEGVENIKAVRAATDLPIIGLSKAKNISDSQRLDNVYITATFTEAKELSEAGADIIALDATGRSRPDGLSLEETIKRIHSELNKPVLADVSTLEEGINAEKYDADMVSTTLYGYTKQTELSRREGPGMGLLGDLVSHLKIPVLLEGRVWQPSEAGLGFLDGAYAVVVGSAITRPELITQRFVEMVPGPIFEKVSLPDTKLLAWIFISIFGLAAVIVTAFRLALLYGPK